MTYEDRFWSRVDMSGDCWLWTRGLNGVGYGMYDAPHKVLAHRYAWELIVGPIPEGVLLDHNPTCPKNCVNPDHLRYATHKQNHENSAGPYASNKSGFLGVSKAGGQRRKCWQAQVNHHGEHFHLGYFYTPEEAHEAAKAKRLELLLQEHICSDGHPDWGDGTDCLNCGGGTKGTTN